MQKLSDTVATVEASFCGLSIVTVSCFMTINTWGQDIDSVFGMFLLHFWYKILFSVEKKGRILDEFDLKTCKLLHGMIKTAHCLNIC